VYLLDNRVFKCCDFVCNLIYALGILSHTRNIFLLSVSREGMTPPACSCADISLASLDTFCCGAMPFETNVLTGRNCCFSEASTGMRWGPLALEGAAFLFVEPVCLFPYNDPVQCSQRRWRSNVKLFPLIVTVQCVA